MSSIFYYEIRLSRDPSPGCRPSTTKGGPILRPTVSLTAANDSACVNQTALSLTGLPSGGTYSGTGVTGSTFNPSVAGLGPKVITYTYSDANNCSNTATTTVLVDACVGVDELVGVTVTVGVSVGVVVFVGVTLGVNVFVGVFVGVGVGVGVAPAGGKAP